MSCIWNMYGIWLNPSDILCAGNLTFHVVTNSVPMSIYGQQESSSQYKNNCYIETVVWVLPI